MSDTGEDFRHRRRLTAETYSRMAEHYEQVGRTDDAARCDGVVARCVRGI